MREIQKGGEEIVSAVARARIVVWVIVWAVVDRDDVLRVIFLPTDHVIVGEQMAALHVHVA